MWRRIAEDESQNQMFFFCLALFLLTEKLAPLDNKLDSHPKRELLCNTNMPHIVIAVSLPAKMNSEF